MKLILALTFFVCISCSTKQKNLDTSARYKSDSTFAESLCNKLFEDYEIDSLFSVRSDTMRGRPLTSIDLLGMYCDKSFLEGQSYSITKMLFFKTKAPMLKVGNIEFCIYNDSTSLASIYSKLKKLSGMQEQDDEFSKCLFTWKDMSINKFYRTKDILVLFQLSGFTTQEIQRIDEQCKGLRIFM